MKAKGITATANTYEHIIAHHANFENLPMCLQTLSEVDKSNIVPTIRTADLVIQTACRMSLPKLAMDVANAFESVSPRRLEGYTWAAILESSCEVLFVSFPFTAP